MIEWRDEFSIGLPEVDQEHRALIATINRLQSEASSGASSQAIAERIGDIHSSVAAHFALEERRMVTLGYDQYIVHKLDHERLLDEILDIQDGVQASDRYDPERLGETLSRWFGEHFRTHDKWLHHWIARQ